jgi:hypothetical protein
MLCLIAIIVLAVMVSNRNKRIRELEGRPDKRILDPYRRLESGSDKDIGIGWLILAVVVVFFGIAMLSA